MNPRSLIDPEYIVVAEDVVPVIVSAIEGLGYFDFADELAATPVEDLPDVMSSRIPALVDTVSSELHEYQYIAIRRMCLAHLAYVPNDLLSKALTEHTKVRRRECGKVAQDALELLDLLQSLGTRTELSEAVRFCAWYENWVELQAFEETASAYSLVPPDSSGPRRKGRAYANFIGTLSEDRQQSWVRILDAEIRRIKKREPAPHRTFGAVSNEVRDWIGARRPHLTYLVEPSLVHIRNASSHQRGVRTGQESTTLTSRSGTNIKFQQEFSVGQLKTEAHATRHLLGIGGAIETALGIHGTEMMIRLLPTLPGAQLPPELGGWAKNALEHETFLHPVSDWVWPKRSRQEQP